MENVVPLPPRTIPNPEQQGKAWCFTYNNPSESLEDFGDALKALKSHSYHFFGTEVGASGTPHYQGYIEFSRLQRLKTLKKFNKKIHWERRKGTQQEAVAYCHKDEGKPGFAFHESGTLSESHQGARTDIAAAVALLQAGGIQRVIDEDPVAYAKYHRGLQALELGRKLPKPIPKVTLLFGAPGSGKTKRVYEDAPDSGVWAQPIGTNGLWFDTYHHDKWALLDDFDGKLSKFPLSALLRLLDRYPLPVPIKGGHVWWVPEVICITTNFHPLDWYDWAERPHQWRALKRRIHQVVWIRDELGHNVDEIDPSDTDLWDRFWAGRVAAQQQLDVESGLLISRAPTSDYYDF